VGAIDRVNGMGFYFSSLPTLGSRLMERKPLQAVATMNVAKLNQILGMSKMLMTPMLLAPLSLRSSPWRLLTEKRR